MQTSDSQYMQKNLLIIPCIALLAYLQYAIVTLIWMSLTWVKGWIQLDHPIKKVSYKCTLDINVDILFSRRLWVFQMKCQLTLRHSWPWFSLDAKVFSLWSAPPHGLIYQVLWIFCIVKVTTGNDSCIKHSHQHSL